MARDRFELAIITLGMAYMEGLERVRQDAARARAVFCQAGALGADLHERLYLAPLSCEEESPTTENEKEPNE